MARAKETASRLIGTEERANKAEKDHEAARKEASEAIAALRASQKEAAAATSALEEYRKRATSAEKDLSSSLQALGEATRLEADVSRLTQELEEQQGAVKASSTPRSRVCCCPLWFSSIRAVFT